MEEIGNIRSLGKSTVRKWEICDIEHMKRNNIKKLAKALRTSPPYIMDFDDEIEKKKQ